MLDRHQIWQLLNQLGSFLEDSIQKTQYWPYTVDNKDIKGNFYYNTRRFAMLLSAAEGEVNYSALEDFNYIFDEDWSRSTFKMNIVSTVDGDIQEILTETPDYLYAIVHADKEHNTELSNSVYKVLYLLGLHFSIQTGFTDNHSAVLAIHLASIKEFIEEAGLTVSEPEVDSEADDDLFINSSATPNLNVPLIVAPQVVPKPTHIQNDESEEGLIAQLDTLIGLPRVKSDVSSLTNYIKVRNMRQDRGLTVSPMSLHLIFTGNPGTGKTTVARLLAKIYKSLGVLSKGHLVEVDRSGLVAGYVGQTALKVKEVAESAKGGILFIDEAYTLSSSKGENDYGREAIDTLLKYMEDHRQDFIVIAAGYNERMHEFLQSNPGLRSRFNKFIHFDDYNSEEMFSIFLKLAKEAGYLLNAGAETTAKLMLTELCQRKGTHFANGRDARNLFEQSIGNQADRVVHLENPSEADLITITESDLTAIMLR